MLDESQPLHSALPVPRLATHTAVFLSIFLLRPAHWYAAWQSLCLSSCPLSVRNMPIHLPAFIFFVSLPSWPSFSLPSCPPLWLLSCPYVCISSCLSDSVYLHSCPSSVISPSYPFFFMYPVICLHSDSLTVNLIARLHVYLPSCIPSSLVLLSASLVWLSANSANPNGVCLHIYPHIPLHIFLHGRRFAHCQPCIIMYFYSYSVCAWQNIMLNFFSSVTCPLALRL